MPTFDLAKIFQYKLEPSVINIYMRRNKQNASIQQPGPSALLPSDLNFFKDEASDGGTRPRSTSTSGSTHIFLYILKYSKQTTNEKGRPSNQLRADRPQQHSQKEQPTKPIKRGFLAFLVGFG